MMKSNILLKKELEYYIIEMLEISHTKKDFDRDIRKLFFGKKKFLKDYSGAIEDKKIEKGEKIRATLIEKVNDSYELEERLKEFCFLPKNYRKEKSEEIYRLRNSIINYLERKDDYISSDNAEILWQHQAKSMKPEIVNSLIEIIEKQSGVLYKLNNVKGIDDGIKIIKDFGGLIDKIEKFETYIKNSNFFEDKYKEAIVDITKYIKKNSLEVLFNQEFVK